MLLPTLRRSRLLRRRALVSPRLGNWGLPNLGLRSRSMMDLGRWRFDFLLRRCSLVYLRLGSWGLPNLGLRSRSMMDLGSWSFDFLHRRGPLHFGSRFWSGHRPGLRDRRGLRFRVAMSGRSMGSILLGRQITRWLRRRTSGRPVRL
jgi:hypothetical protein